MDVLWWRRHAAACLVALVAILACAPTPARADFELGLQDPSFNLPASDPANQFAYHTLAAIHGSTIRLSVDWPSIAPNDTLPPLLFNASNPADPQYHWAPLDAAIETAVAHHLGVILQVDGAPPWAQPSGRPSWADGFPYPSAWNPDPGAFAQFMGAAARRYSGHFPDPAHPGKNLPRVRDWEIWNEENLPYDLTAPDLVAEYRALLDGAYAAIKAVDPTDVVAIGGLAPVSFVGKLSISPLTFAAQLMCLNRVGVAFVRRNSCQPAHFDVLATHPYTLSATPTKHAYHYDDVLIGDMNKISSLVSTANALHAVQPAIQAQTWVTEWGWFTDPPDTQVGDPPALTARYVAYSMYEMWRAGVSRVIWFVAQDAAVTGQNSPSFFYGGGLYDSSGRPKPTLRAFAFPFVAGVSHRRGFGWGRAPVGGGGRVVVEQRAGRRWRRVALARTGPDGVFFARFRARHNGFYRARVVHGAVSLAYDSTPIPPRQTHAFYSG